MLRILGKYTYVCTQVEYLFPQGWFLELLHHCWHGCRRHVHYRADTSMSLQLCEMISLVERRSRFIAAKKGARKRAGGVQVFASLMTSSWFQLHLDTLLAVCTFFSKGQSSIKLTNLCIFKVI